jgi:hypothetical protein
MLQRRKAGSEGKNPLNSSLAHSVPGMEFKQKGKGNTVMNAGNKNTACHALALIN